jgi:dTDP-4-dehydrorhamnose 3,5-epimerase
MRFSETKLRGAFIIDLEPVCDERGFFARTFCVDEFARRGLNPRLAQCAISYNEKRGTLRGMHMQVRPHAETKLVRCTMGMIYDVLVDVRQDSPTFRQWLAVQISATDRRMLYVPDGVAHGFQTLEDRTEVLYHLSEFYHPECQRGFRWNDPALGIEWPLPVAVISARDQAFDDLNAQ